MLKVNVRSRNINTKRLKDRYGKAALDNYLFRVQQLNNVHTPFKTGRLRNSFRYIRNRASITFRWTAPYARYVDRIRMFTKKIFTRARS